MDLFSYVVSLYGVIAGLGIILLVRSIGQMIESHARIRFYWVHACWLAFVFVLHINSWFTLWGYRAETSWTVGQLLLLLSVPMLLYLASHVSVPEIAANSSDRYDMEAHYYARHRALLGLLALSVFVNLASEYLLLENDPLTHLNGLRMAGLALLILGTVSARPRLHQAITLLALGLLLYSFGFINAPIAD